jgi:hypothetical protein
LETANTVQGELITAIEDDVTDNALRITNLDVSLTDNAGRITSLEATDSAFATLIVNLRTDLEDTFITKTTDSTVITSNLEVTGNIFMHGNRFVVESETTLINDAIIGIANNNTTVMTDVGILMQRPTANVALVHHGGTDKFTIGYTQDNLEATNITNDTVNEINVNVLGQLHVQNNLTIGAGGSYFGDGTTLTGVALSTDMTSNASRISTLESANIVQKNLITDLRTDMTSNSGRLDTLEPRVTNLEFSNVDIWSNLALLTLDDVVNVNNVTANTVQFTNAITSLVASGNVTVSGNVTSITSLTSNAATIGTTKTFVVRAAGGAYYIDDVIRKPLELHEHQTYIFDLSDSSLASGAHPFSFSTGGTDGSGTPYSAGISTTGTAGTTGAKKTFVVPVGTTSPINYYCSIHGGMGSTMSIASTSELIVSGRVVASGNVEASTFKGDGTELTGVALETDLASNVTRIATLETANTVQGLLITVIEDDMTDNALRVTNLTTSNVDIWSNLTSNVTRIATLETSNTVQGLLITDLRTDMTSNSGRLDALEPRVTNLEFSNVDIWSNLALLTLNDVVNVNNATSNTVQFTNTTTSLIASGNVTVSGNITSTTSLISNAATIGTTKTFVVTAAGGAYYIDGVIRKPLELHEHQTYIFDLSDSSLASGAHPFS